MQQLLPCPMSRTARFSLSVEIERANERPDTTEHASRDQTLTRERGQGNIYSHSRAHHGQDRHPHLVDPSSAESVLPYKNTYTLCTPVQHGTLHRLDWTRLRLWWQLCPDSHVALGAIHIYSYREITVALYLFNLSGAFSGFTR